MISYDLAKELKDAGFPQEHLDDRDFVEIHEALAIHNILDQEKYEQYFDPHRPNLSELIKACGEGRLELRRENQKWSVEFKVPNTERTLGPIFNSRQKFRSVEEAVAKLWLTLNKKNGK